jgi:hypothetical protein
MTDDDNDHYHQSSLIQYIETNSPDVVVFDDDESTSVLDAMRTLTNNRLLFTNFYTFGLVQSSKTWLFVASNGYNIHALVKMIKRQHSNIRMVYWNGNQFSDV